MYTYTHMYNVNVSIDKKDLKLSTVKYSEVEIWKFRAYHITSDYDLRPANVTINLI